jgi:excisionase family DNA binding protein
VLGIDDPTGTLFPQASRGFGEISGKFKRLRCKAHGTTSAFARCMLQEPGPISDQEKSLLIEAAAQLLGVSRRTVYYRIHEGRLRTIRTRCGSQRVLLSSIEMLLRAGREGDRRRRAACAPAAGVTGQDAGA